MIDSLKMKYNKLKHSRYDVVMSALSNKSWLYVFDIKYRALNLDYIFIVLTEIISCKHEIASIDYMMRK